MCKFINSKCGVPDFFTPRLRKWGELDNITSTVCAFYIRKTGSSYLPKNMCLSVISSSVDRDIIFQIDISYKWEWDFKQLFITRLPDGRVVSAGVSGTWNVLSQSGGHEFAWTPVGSNLGCIVLLSKTQSRSSTKTFYKILTSINYEDDAADMFRQRDVKTMSVSIITAQKNNYPPADHHAIHLHKCPISKS